ncbi:MAG: peptidoglycan DD-metalloendopeptidase family protein [Patescibacteria group bacterium]|jgi:murein DD-endopeptidase MepM/ murein hydrolase activator NlpD
MKNRKFKFLILLIISFLLVSSFRQPKTVYGGDLDQEIQDLNLKIQNQKKQLDTLQARQQQYQAQIQAKRNDKITLSNQLSIIEDELTQAQLEIDGVNLRINKITLEIQKNELDGQNLDQQIETTKQHISTLLQNMYKQDQVSTLEALLLNNSLSDFLSQARYLTDTSQELNKNVADLRNRKEQLDKNKVDLDQKNAELVDLKVQLNIKNDNLTYEQQNKNNLLAETDSSEKQYQALLQQGLILQRQAEAEISSAEQLVRQKMSKKDQLRLNEGDGTINWPVPQNIITTTFHDPDYPYRKLIGEHSGVDIRAKQGTTITAAASGYVAKIKFDGTKNYAYIMIIHGNGLSTVYGHVSAAYVTTDQYVTQGQAIGRSGATPGSIGAGPFTTGPHLHFEVRLNGLPVNPLSYLP